MDFISADVLSGDTESEVPNYVTEACLANGHSGASSYLGPGYYSVTLEHID
ncbi:MAG: hypothetical protein IJZ42_05485 [Lachnospiraceae bacterium]|nr:hypothetical protein [Lachnospiraceae bacterium]